MKQRREHGFTLIELLVVIAIIGILAAMLFPVFARARESARKTQCLANVKNIAMGMQIYLTDYDRLPPKEHRAEIVDWYGDGCWIDISMVNPYLQWPVILDEYIKSREVWRCPSARLLQKRGILNSYGKDWWTYMIDQGGKNLCWGLGPCATQYPSGWGGSVTDGIIQQTCAIDASSNASNGAFVQNIGVPDAREMSTSEMDDTSKFVVCADCGTTRMFWAATQIAYPDTCAIYCSANMSYNGMSCTAKTQGCTTAKDCFGPDHPSIVWDAAARKQYAYSRHMGGSNLGFADGHAKWFSGEAILTGASDERWFINESDRNKDPFLTGVQECGAMNLPGSAYTH